MEKNKRDKFNLSPSENPKKSKNFPFLFFMILLGIGFLYFFRSDGISKSDKHKVSYSDFLVMIENPNIKWNEVEIIERDIKGNFLIKDSVSDSDAEYLASRYSDYTLFNKQTNSKSFFIWTYGPVQTDSSLIDILREKNISFKISPESRNYFQEIILQILPFVLIIALLWFFLFRQIQTTGNKALSFGKSRAKMFNMTSVKVKFDDVAGVDEAKEELKETVEFLKTPEKFKKLGAKIPKGILLVGPPGTGKTLLAKSVAGEASCPFFSISGSDFVEMFVGIGASRVRDLFEQSRKHAPCIVFIDELDAVGRVRGAGYGGGHDEREQTLNQMLVEMDGFDGESTVIVIAATNRPDVLDPALLRPGRFDRRVIVGSPDVKGREAILNIHTKKLPVDESVNLSLIARGTPGLSGADLANIVNEAAIFAAKFNKNKIEMSDFEHAKDKVLMGPERKSMLITDIEKKNTAYHEAGHALLSFILPKVNPLYKVSIIPRGHALGITQMLPQEDRLTLTKEHLLEEMMVLFGGRIAEEYCFENQGITNGASNDIERATKIARAMVCEWGMSESLGPITYGQAEKPIFIGKEIAQHKDYSENTADKIDSEIRKIIDITFKSAKSLINNNSDKLEEIAKQLLEKEILDLEDIKDIFASERKVEKLKDCNINISQK